MSKKAKRQDNISMNDPSSLHDPYLMFGNLSRSVDELEVSVRTANNLRHAKIHFIADLIQKTETGLLHLGFGQKSIYELKELLAEMGLSLGMEFEGLKFKSEADSKKAEFVAIGLFGNRLKLVSLRRDGRFVFLDEVNTYGGLYIVTSETRALKKAADELEALMNDKNTKEEELQDFFERNPEFILNDEYKKAHPKVVLEKKKDGSLVPDFILEPYNIERLCDVLDLKLPSAKVWILKKNRPRFSQSVFDAIAQLREYSQFFDEEENRMSILNKYGLISYRPKLFVIIGRKGKVDPLVRRRIEVGFHDVAVFTYDDIIERIRQKIISKEKRSNK